LPGPGRDDVGVEQAQVGQRIERADLGERLTANEQTEAAQSFHFHPLAALLVAEFDSELIDGLHVHQRPASCNY
jgi:hypothetical protein